jgi:hypothetical protein
MDTTIARIEFAFAHVPRPPDEELVDERAVTAAPVDALVGVEAWQQLADDDVEHAYPALAVLSPDAFRHFLPAYMRWICRHGEERPDAPVVAATLAALTPRSGEGAALSTARFRMLDAEQATCIAAFLEREAGRPDAREARAYWRMRAGYLPSASDAD